MIEAISQDIPIFDNYNELMQWCRDVREGKIKTSNEARNYAKQMTYHEYYGSTIKLGT